MPAGNSLKLSSPLTREYWEIPVLFEDEHLLAVAKPAELLTSPDRYDPTRPNLMRLLHEGIARGAPWAKQRQITYLANVHRLDFGTSGVLLLTKNKPALITLANLFSTAKPKKFYVALAHGRPLADQFSVDARLAPHPTETGLVRIDAKTGKQALTHVTRLEQFRGCVLLQCEPVTGRTHQIRVHLRHSRLPLVGDEQYGGRPLLLSTLKPNYDLKPGATERPLISRVALHAERLLIPHPVTGAGIEIIAPWPKDLTVAVKYLRRYAAANATAPGAEPACNQSPAPQ